MNRDMAKKELTYLDILKKEYSELVKINQRLKYISKGYYISYDGTIYLQSLVGFEEAVVMLRYPEKLKYFKGGTILPNSFFNFSKQAKKTKLTIEETENEKGKCFIFGQEDGDLSYTYQITNPDSCIDDQYVTEVIRPHMYKRFYDDFANAIEYEKSDFLMLSEKQVMTIVEAKPLYLTYNENEFVLTKHIVLDIKKGDALGIRRLYYFPIENGKKKVYYFLKHVTDLYEKIILISTVQS